MSGNKTCFVIAPIGGEGSDTRERSDTVFEEVIQEVVEDFEYECKRADHIQEPGSITNQVIEYIVESELVVADLTDKNPNVFYELAVRHAYQRPVIQLINRNQDIPFDVSNQRTINIDLEDFSTTKSAQEKIRNQIKQIESNEFEVENPVSLAGRIRELKESDEPEKQELAEFTELLNEINSKVHSIEKEIENPENILPEEYLKNAQNSIQNRNHKKIFWEIKMVETELKELAEHISENGRTRNKLVSDLKEFADRLSRTRNRLEHNQVTMDEYKKL